MVSLGAQQDLIGDCSAQRADLASAQVGERPEAGHVRCPHAQHFAESIVGNGQGQRRSARQRVLDAAQADVRVAPGDGLVDRREHDLHELRRAPQAACEEAGDLDVEADLLLRMRRVGLDKRRAAFGVARPAKQARLAGSDLSRKAKDQNQAEEAER